MSYQPGTHIIATLHTEKIDLLEQSAAFQQLADQLIETYGLKKLGEIYHQFQPSGFTGVVCLSESHLSIHTWPEYKKVNLDIYLSNYLRTNDDTVVHIYEAICVHFDAVITNEQRLKR